MTFNQVQDAFRQGVRFGKGRTLFKYQNLLQVGVCSKEVSR